ncbi:hypothetical protein FB451DRAFT_1204980 [Mycena latifolia]|nr:hypothetical protein FB451DRAFT_1204980 [Mycena latifolia]
MLGRLSSAMSAEGSAEGTPEVEGEFEEAGMEVDEGASTSVDMDMDGDVGTDMRARAAAWIAEMQVLVKGKRQLERAALKSLADTLRTIANLDVDEGRAIGVRCGFLSSNSLPCSSLFSLGAGRAISAAGEHLAGRAAGRKSRVGACRRVARTFIAKRILAHVSLEIMSNNESAFAPRPAVPAGRELACCQREIAYRNSRGER